MSLVTKVDAGFQKLAHVEVRYGHRAYSSFSGSVRRGELPLGLSPKGPEGKGQQPEVPVMALTHPACEMGRVIVMAGVSRKPQRMPWAYAKLGPTALNP
jgi:hypothetical protein